jgi:multiple sugar transport system ATP-binding protein
MHDGRIEQIGAPLELYDRPANLFVAGFIGSPAMNFIPGTIERNGAGPVVRTADNTLLPLPQDAPGEVGKAVRYGVRPAHLSLAGAGEPAIEAVVDVVEPTGDDIFVYCSMAGQEVWAMFSERHDFAPGQRIQLRPQLERVHLFDAESGQRF